MSRSGASASREEDTVHTTTTKNVWNVNFFFGRFPSIRNNKRAKKKTKNIYCVARSNFSRVPAFIL